MEIVLREASRLDQLVSQFLAFARPAPLRRREVDLAVLVEETLAVFSHDPLAARLRIERETAGAAVEGDPDQLRQVLWNLLSNAAQAMAGEGAPQVGGRIRVACGGDPAGGWLEVADDGPGMAPHVRERLFLPFFTTQASGTGLGLATVHRIVDAHGGAISVETGPGRGTRFRVRLPRAASAPPDLG